MKNFPHQHTSFSNLRAALTAIQALSELGKDPSDDGVLGDRLARDMVHRFRDINYETTEDLAQRIENQLVEEHSKTASNQGARTAARENRKTLRHLGWLQDQSTRMAIAGVALLDSPEGSLEEMDIIRAAVAQIELEDGDGNTSHPMLVLLRLIDNFDFYTRDGMELALEAKDDSVEEFERIEALVNDDPVTRRQKLNSAGVSDHRIANAKKILPVYAEKSGLIERDTNRKYVVTSAGAQFLSIQTESAISHSSETGTHPHTLRRGITQTTDPAKVGRSRAVTAAGLYTRNSGEQHAAAALLDERTERHQQLVRNTAGHCSLRDGMRKFSEGTYDLVINSGVEEPIDLIEAKTINGDARSQVRAALGQLLYYEYFLVQPNFPDQAIVKSIVIDQKIDADLVQFLTAQDVGVLVVTHEDMYSQNELGSEIVERLAS